MRALGGNSALIFARAWLSVLAQRNQPRRSSIRALKPWWLKSAPEDRGGSTQSSRALTPSSGMTQSSVRKYYADAKTRPPTVFTRRSSGLEDDPMNDRLPQEPQRTKRAYSKPELVQVPLRPEEAVLGNCKVSGATGPGGTETCHPVGNCFSEGS